MARADTPDLRGAAGRPPSRGPGLRGPRPADVPGRGEVIRGSGSRDPGDFAGGTYRGTAPRLQESHGIHGPARGRDPARRIHVRPRRGPEVRRAGVEAAVPGGD